MSKPRVILPGSHRDPVPHHQTLGPVDSLERIYVTVVLRRKAEVLPITPYGAPMRPDEYAEAHGASAIDFLTVRKFAEEYGLEPRNESAASRTIELHGTVGDLSRAFGVTLEKAIVKDTRFRHRTGDITIPEDLIPAVQAVLGLDDRPTAKPHRVRGDHARPAAIHSSLSTPEVAQLYAFPEHLDGSRQIIAIIELDGGFLSADIDAYFKELGMHAPKVRAVLIDGQTNQIDKHLPQHPELNADDEVALDIQVAGAVAPGAKQLVYFAQNTDQSFLKAVNAAIHADPMSAAISISWGAAERLYSTQMMRAFDSALQDAANLGIPVCVAAGDDGSFDGTGSLQVDFPASAPHALGCGGTRLVNSNGAIASETVWNAATTDEHGNRVRKGTGGGVSQVFSKPSYQSEANVPASPKEHIGGRGVPDVCGNADPATGYKIRLKGAETIVGGTSAVAPLWAGLIARFAQAFGGRVGFLHPQIYKPFISTPGFRDITQGDNDSRGEGGLYQAGPGWDACTGLGSPNGTALLSALGGPAPPHPPRPHPTPTPHPAPSPHPRPQPTPTPRPTPMPTPHQTSVPQPKRVTGKTGGGTQIDFLPLPAPVPEPTPAPALESLVSTSPPMIGAPGAAMRGSNTTAIVGVVGLTAVMGLVAATGLVASMAIAKKKP